MQNHDYTLEKLVYACLNDTFCSIISQCNTDYDLSLLTFINTTLSLYIYVFVPDLLGKSLQVLTSSSVLLQKLRQLQRTEVLQSRGRVLQEEEEEDKVNVSQLYNVTAVVCVISNDLTVKKLLNRKCFYRVFIKF